MLLGMPCNATIAQWERHTIDDSSRGADGVKAADINGDGRLDLVTGWEEGGLIRVCLHPETSMTIEPWPAVTVGSMQSPEDAVFVDLDNDGVYEVVSCCEGRTKALFVHRCINSQEILQPDSWATSPIDIGQPPRQWMFATPLPSLAGTDVRIVAGAKGEGAELGLLTMSGDLSDSPTWTWEPLQPVGWIMSIETVDVDSDGDFDILFSDRRGPARGVHWYEDEGGQWHLHTVGGTDHEVMFLDTGDLDGDGILEIVCAARDAGILVFSRDSQDSVDWNVDTIPLGDNCGSGKGAAVFDVNCDGMNDIVFSCENSEQKIGVGWLSAPDWELHDISGSESGSKFDLLLPMDVNGDGWIDVITCEERDNLGVIWYQNPGV